MRQWETRWDKRFSARNKSPRIERSSRAYEREVSGAFWNIADAPDANDTELRLQAYICRYEADVALARTRCAERCSVRTTIAGEGSDHDAATDLAFSEYCAFFFKEDIVKSGSGFASDCKSGCFAVHVYLGVALT